MIVTVEFFVNSGILQAEIGAQINDAAAQLQQWNGELRRDPVRQRQEDDVRLLRQHFRVRLAEAQRPGARMAGESGKNPGERLTRILARSDGAQFRVRMRQQEPHEFLTGVTGGANNCDFDRSFRFHFSKNPRRFSR